MTKLYERDGRRFVTAIDHTSHYLNSDYTLSEKKTENSIAVCVLHTVKEMVFCELNDNPPCLNWDDAKEYCSKQFLGQGRLPEIHELVWAMNTAIEFDGVKYYGPVWSNSECGRNNALYTFLEFAFCSKTIKCCDKQIKNQVLAFLTVDL